MNKELDLGIALHPSLTINNMTYRGYLDSDDIFDAICSSFNKMPQVCKDPLDKNIQDYVHPDFNDLDHDA